MSESNLRARSISEIIDAAFALYRRNVSQYILVTALASTPGLLMQMFLLSGTTPLQPTDFLKFLWPALVNMVTFALMTGVVQKAGSQVYLGGEIDLATTVRDVLPMLPKLILASVLYFILTVIGLLGLIIGVFYVMARYFAVVPAIVLEDRDAFVAFERSSDLTNGYKWHVLGTLALLYGLYFVLSLGVSGLAQLMPSVTLTLILTTAYSILAYPVIGLSTMLLYYDLRIRGEAFDLEQMAESLGPTTAPATDTSPL